MVYVCYSKGYNFLFYKHNSIYSNTVNGSIRTIKIDGVEVIRVDFRGDDIPYSAFGKYYIRVADEDRELTPSELRKLMISKEYEDNWESRISDETIEDAD